MRIRVFKRWSLMGMGVMMLAVTCLMASCNKEMFNEEDYKQILKYLSPVDSVDQRHNWELTRNLTYTITASAGSKAQLARIYLDDPLTNVAAELLAQTSISDGKSVTLSISAPTYMKKVPGNILEPPTVTQTIYAALVNEDGTLTVQSSNINDRNIIVDRSSERGTPKGTEPRLQEFTYLFEQDMPQPGDYDYNDLVMRLSMLRSGQTTMDITMTIDAVGANDQLGAALRLVGYSYNDIDSVVALTNESLNEGLPAMYEYFFKSKDLLLKGRNNEAVIQFFEDAHWAMDKNLDVKNDFFERKYYNVSNMSGGDFVTKKSRSMTYRVYFKSDRGLNQFSMNMLDPFITTMVLGAIWETHTYGYRNAQTMYEYRLPLDINDLPWALKIPTGSFMHTLEGKNLGFRKSGALFGAYMTIKHSFGEWAEDYNSCLDWYYNNYATTNQIY